MASKVNVYAGNMDFIASTDQIEWMELKTNIALTFCAAHTRWMRQYFEFECYLN